MLSGVHYPLFGSVLLTLSHYFCCLLSSSAFLWSPICWTFLELLHIMRRSCILSTDISLVLWTYFRFQYYVQVTSLEIWNGYDLTTFFDTTPLFCSKDDNLASLDQQRETFRNSTKSAEYFAEKVMLAWYLISRHLRLKERIITLKSIGYPKTFMSVYPH